MNQRWLLLFFLLSGFCSLVYQVVWLRLAMAAFGCNGMIVSLVLSVFMAGLGIGSRLVALSETWLDEHDCGRALRIYALCEALIAVGALLVPLAFEQARHLLDSSLGQVGWGSTSHYMVAGLMIALILLPWTILMGATLPLGMATITASKATSPRSFSFLYAANLLGATLGTLASALVLIELLGFHGTLLPASFVNVLIALGAYILSKRLPARSAPAAPPHADPFELPPAGSSTPPTPHAVALLFVAGLTTMALEITWFRLYTFHFGTSVYAFAGILGLYLVFNFLGSIGYRRLSNVNRLPDSSVLLALIGLSALFGLVCADPGWSATWWTPNLRLLLGVAPFALLSGFLTPLLMDQISVGSSRIAGRAYAWNLLGCIVGPLLASFVLLPLLGERLATIVLAVPYFAFALHGLVGRRSFDTRRLWLRGGVVALCVAVALLLGLEYRTIYERLASMHPAARLLRDFEASTIAFDDKPSPQHQLMVNGFGMSRKTPVTKTMAHFPLALLPHRPERILVICFGMGTTFRSGMSWGINTDTVDLVPAVPQMFDLFFDDASVLLNDPRGRVLIDDGRRFLRRSSELYDVITIDPPPPIEGAATSLLYSQEFFLAAKQRLKPSGLLQHWIGGAKYGTPASVLRAAKGVFPYVRTFRSLEGWGLHILCSDSPIITPSAQVLAGRMPAAAARDFTEWGPMTDAQDQFGKLLGGELSPDGMIATGPDALVLTDDRPFNEYYLIRATFPRFWSWWAR